MIKVLTSFLRLKNLLPLCLSLSSFAEQDFWDPKLYEQNSTMQRRWGQQLLKSSSIKLCNNILDVGSGEGGITALLAKEKPRRDVLGIDLSNKMVEFAKSKHAQNNLEFKQADVEKLSFKNDFDAVVSFSTMHRVPNPDVALKKIYNALKPGGHLLMAFPALGSKLLSLCIAKIDSSPKWRGIFKNRDRKKYNNSKNRYRDLLANAGFSVERLNILWEDEVFESKEHFQTTGQKHSVIPC